jgi:nitroreductase
LSIFWLSQEMVHCKLGAQKILAMEPSVSLNDDANLPTCDELIHLRYRDGAAPEGPWNETLATLLAHRSVRAFVRDPLPPGTLERLVAAASSASTSSNLQTWSVVAVEDPARKARLAALGSGQKHIEVAPLYLVWCVDHSRLHQAAAERQLTLEGVNYLEPFIVGVVDATLAAQNAAVALESLGLSFVYIGAMRNHPEKVAAELGLPPHVMALFGMCVGYEDRAKPAHVKPRLPQAAILHREQYSSEAGPREFAAYDARLVEFQREEGMKDNPWTELATNRVKTAQSLNGRDRMREALNNLGFPIR